MGLNHDYLIIDKSEFDVNGISAYHHSNQAVLLHDDFISYIYDTLNWIPSYDPQSKKIQIGFDRWGPNIYDYESAEKLKTIFSSWANIFNEGPELLNLKGSWSYYNVDTDEYDDEGQYERLYYNRIEIVSNLNEIANWAVEVIESKGSKIILHLGI